MTTQTTMSRPASRLATPNRALRAGLVLLSMLAAGNAQAYDPNLATVPWFGNPNSPHQVYDGGQLVLQGVATDLDTGAALCISSATWDAGDGTGTVAIGTNGYALERTHTYNNGDPVGTPYTATLTVTLCSQAPYNGEVLSDGMKVRISPNTQDTKANMAIDKGLWNLHKRMRRSTSDGLPSAWWTGYSSYYMAATAGVVQAFQINGHREGGNRREDPYVENAARGIRYILSQQHSRLMVTGVPWQPNSHNPDGNGNGYSLAINHGNHASYLGGQLIDALVSSGTPDKLAETGIAGSVKGRTYKDIVQDLLDGYSAGFSWTYGGWWYNFRQIGGAWNANDTSASHWWAIGVLAAENWGLDAPGWLKDRQWTHGVPFMQRYVPPDSCYFGYTNRQSYAWDAGMNVTAAGLILMNADDVPQTHPRYACAEGWLSKYWTSYGIGNFYTMYQVAKAMRTAQDDNGDPAPIETLYDADYLGDAPSTGRAKDWYSDFASHLIANQTPDGRFYSTRGTVSYYINYGSDMATSWGVIMLSKSLFKLPPTAACSVDSSSVCQAGASGGCNTTGLDPYAEANFDGTQSTPGDNPIASYEWDFADGDSAIGDTASHEFSSIGTFNVELTVTDTEGISSSVTCPIEVTDSALPPIADPGGPYHVCEGGGPVELDGTGSTGRGATIVLYEWDLTTPTDFSPADVSGAAATTATFDSASLAPGAYDVALRVSDDSASGFVETGFTTVTVEARSENSMLCPLNQPPVAECQDIGVQADGMCAATVSAAQVDNGSSDPDGDPLNLSLSQTQFSGLGALGDNPVTLTANDGTEADSCNATVTMFDATPPDISCPAGATLEFPADTTVAANGSATATDNCSLDNIGSADTVTPGCGATLTISRLWTATDGSGNPASCTQTISVVDTTPPVAADDPYSTDEDTVLNVAAPGILSNDSDASGALTLALGSGPSDGTLVLNANGSFDYTPDADFNGSDSYTYTVTDACGNSSVGTVNITVNPVNDPPVVDTSASATSGDEGSPIAMSVSVTDVDSLTFTYLWSVTGPASCSFDDATSASPDLACSDNGAYTASVAVSDGEDTTSGNVSVTVANVDPVITEVTATLDPQPVGAAIDVSAPFTDAGTNDTHSCTIDWDDGFGPVAATVDPQNAGSGTCTGSRTDLPAGVYGVTVTVTDDDGGSDTESATTLIVVYDPGAGFVTGGGWFNSLAGADTLNPDAVGKANFGFVAKYKRGAQVPDGQTEFQFKAGDLNFHSTDYQWLVVTGGCMAQYKGTGTINGEPGYDFMLTLRDGSLCGNPTDDGFRIKITGPGGLRYDNTGGGDNIGPQSGNVQPIDGGSIKIHRKK